MKVFLSVAFVLLALFCVAGYVKNIYKLCMADFEPSYKEEVLRVIGLPVAPLGVILGYIDFNEE